MTVFTYLRIMICNHNINPFFPASAIRGDFLFTFHKTHISYLSFNLKIKKSLDFHL